MVTPPLCQGGDCFGWQREGKKESERMERERREGRGKGEGEEGGR
jgi:hypothetical protein